MSNKPPQDLKSHSHLVPGFHGLTFLLLALNLVWTIRTAIRGPSTDTVIPALTAFALILLFLYARRFATANQDRIIRLEERIRLSRLLPDDLRGRVDDLTTEQLVALRFASDGEVSELVRKVLTDGIAGQKAIKEQIGTWRPDYHRV